MSTNTREDVILRELRTMVNFALWTPLEDERVACTPLEAATKLLNFDPSVELDLDEKTAEVVCDRRSWAETVLAVVAPLLEKAAPPPALARVLARLAQQHPRSQLVPMLSPAITRCLKHTVDFGKSPDMRKLLQVRRLISFTLFDYPSEIKGDRPFPFRFSFGTRIMHKKKEKNKVLLTIFASRTNYDKRQESANVTTLRCV